MKMKLVKRISAYLARRNRINKTVSELSSLTNRELADLGISRGQIHSIAYETADPEQLGEVSVNSNLKGFV